jgi:hypothetical protein
MRSSTPEFMEPRKCIYSLTSADTQLALPFLVYSYLDSGKRATELFRERGFTTLVENGLVNYVLKVSCITVVGIFTGCMAVLLDHIVSKLLNPPDADFESFLFGPLTAWRYWAFAIGFLCGFHVSFVMANVVKGGINTLIVCWADEPETFAMNHPIFTDEMAEIWCQAFPDIKANRRPLYAAVAH